jgi:hypothetical protein
VYLGAVHCLHSACGCKGSQAVCVGQLQVLKTPVHQVLRGLERARVHAQASQLSAGCLRVGVFKAW